MSQFNRENRKNVEQKPSTFFNFKEMLPFFQHDLTLPSGCAIRCRFTCRPFVIVDFDSNGNLSDLKSKFSPTGQNALRKPTPMEDEQ